MLLSTHLAIANLLQCRHLAQSDQVRGFTRNRIALHTGNRSDFAFLPLSIIRNKFHLVQISLDVDLIQARGMSTITELLALCRPEKWCFLESLGCLGSNGFAYNASVITSDLSAQVKRQVNA